MNVEMGTKVMAVHGGTFNMPARSPFAPGGWPDGLAGLCPLPENKIQRVAFIFIHFDAGPGTKHGNILSRKLSIVFCRCSGEHDVTILCNVSKLSMQKSFDHTDDLWDVLCGTRFDVWWQDA